MFIRPLSSLLLIFSLASGALAEEFTGKVVGVSDGDTLSVMHNGKAEKVRLHGVDAPESAQAFGTRAKQATSELVFGKEVTVQVEEKDRYGRSVGVVRLPDGRILNRELVRDGMAWWYKQYAKKDTELSRLETEARNARRGLWADANPTPPWEFRREKRDGNEKNKAAADSKGDKATTAPAKPGTLTGTQREGNLTTGTSAEAPATTVYVTERANRYHRAECKSIQGRGMPISLSEAKARGIKPCGTCKP